MECASGCRLTGWSREEYSIYLSESQSLGMIYIYYSCVSSRRCGAAAVNYYLYIYTQGITTTTTIIGLASEVRDFIARLMSISQTVYYNAFGEDCGWSQVVVVVVVGSGSGGGGTTNRVVVRETRGPDADNGRWNVVKPETHVHVIEG